MPKYKMCSVTCYCGREFVVDVGQPARCECGVIIHTQQKKGGGRVWGTTNNPNRLKMIIAQGLTISATFLDN